jgi:perosamine synthetase
MPRTVTVGHFEAGPKEKEYVNQVLDSGRLSYGPFSRRFEEEWARVHGCKHAVFCNSGTSALHIAVQALKEANGWANGDEVIVPSVTFVATSNVVIHNNLKPVFVDVDPLTYNIDPAAIPGKITSRTRAIIPVHLTGLPADMPRICEIAKDNGLKVIEDSCETTFAHCRGKPVGSWGTIGCFSTYMAHYIVTGVGGLTTTSDPDLAVRMRSLMNHGRDSIYLSIDDDNGKTPEEMRKIVSGRFRFVSFGHSFRCTEMEAALGLAQLERKREIVAARKRIAARYTAGLSGLQSVLQLPFEPFGFEHVYMMYPVVVRGGVSKRQLVNHLEERGVETRDLLPLLGQPVYRGHFGELLARNPVARRLNEDGFYVGCHQYLTDDDVDYVVDVIHEFLGRKRS